MIDYDSELQLHNERLRTAYAIQATDRVLDVGCGAGQTTREAARLASDGEALGLDSDQDMVARAREMAQRERVPNVRFELGNAQVYPFRTDLFDVAISRFGTMFFDDPIEAFRNIAGALQPGGRLVMAVWQAREQNEWAVAIKEALDVQSPEEATASSRNAFSLAEPATVRRILAAAGFADSHFEDVDVPVFYGPNVDAAFAFVRRFAYVRDLLNRSSAHEAETITARLRATFERRASPSGVWLGSRAWIVTARRPPTESRSERLPFSGETRAFDVA